ncbi:Cytochrome c [Planctopirus ephydatiae]|uniref:Cytochrome c n=1 Tax=Planctopirus ephydatiae TaxID=2528019 RepID=A0A518GMK8_9PLAN|nr:PVC-type heme-binding CxxCH protein [Planctopirus ephydatiae]QDV29885.1 Cytochrome c [Planctopirus ephydatiae]
MRKLTNQFAAALLVVGNWISPLPAAEVPPKVLDDRLQLECVLDSPAIATPTGLDVDSQGRIWVIENNTHFRPGSYSRHPLDRVLVFQPQSQASGKTDKPTEVPLTVFKNDLKNSMSLLLGERDPLAREATKNLVFIATRSQILKCQDHDGDGKCDESQVLINFETTGNYPHNGLSGLAWHPSGKLIFGCGENLGASYELKGADGKVIAGGGEGGNVYRCDILGHALEQVATGFWNPYASAFTKAGDWFTVDNDPDSRPPCRLLHVIEGGDYGYRFRNGRKGTHPFTSWNGEIPGTLPMVCGTGEAPSGIIVHSGKGFPADYNQTLLVTSWGDHRIEQYMLKPRGTSFGADFRTIVIGGEDFRPVSIQQDSAGNVYFSDWVKRDYQLHGQGRVWKLSPKLATSSKDGLVAIDAPRSSASSGLADPFVFRRRLVESAKQPSEELIQALKVATNPYAAELAFLALRQQKGLTSEVLSMAATSPHPSVRRLLVQAVAEDRLPDAQKWIEQVLTGDLSSKDLFLAALAARAMISGQPPAEFEKAPPATLAKPILFDSTQNAGIRALALELLNPDDPALNDQFFQEALKGPEPLRTAAVRSLARASQPARKKLLTNIAIDESLPVELRLDALAGLILPPTTTAEAGAQSSAEITPSILKLLDSPDPRIQSSAIRTLRNVLKPQIAASPELARKIEKIQSTGQGDVLEQLKIATASAEPTATPASIDWNSRGDHHAGRRVFFSADATSCAKCHRVDGAGGNVGPDLSGIARTMNRQKLAESIIEPSREISPQFSTLALEMTDGRTITGMLADGSPKGMIRIRNHEGVVSDIPLDQIEEQSVSRESLMPKGLIQQMTPQEFRDLLSYLETLK